MVVLTHGNIMFSETTAPSAFVDVRGVGPFTQTVNSKISRQVSDLLRRDLGIPTERIYLNFTSFQPSHWGWNGETF
jgi:phenylpyruvate tautomerase PptA (4-oxalocrotonate tautomerase family)